MSFYRNVTEIIVPNDMCIGCGLCVGVCPPDVLQMGFNRYGEYVVHEYKEGCLPKCDLCLRACPFWTQADDETSLAEKAFGSVAEIQHSVEVGYFLQCYVGYSKRVGQRMNASSGGLATWFLQRLLEEDVVDKVVSVVANDDPNRLFKFAVLDSVADVQSASRSCYYPVEMGDIIREIVATNGRYAITGLPCFLKGIRLAMRKNRRLRERVTVLVGLVCGQSKNRQFVEYLTAVSGGDPHHLQQVTFRVKDENRRASDYAHAFKWQQNGQPQESKLFWATGIDQAWLHDYFKPNACHFCDDVFAETADVTFMDAWLPEYIPDYRGHTIVINRNPALAEIWQTAHQSPDVVLQPIDIAKTIASQKGVLKEKREGLQYRLSLTEKQPDKYIPTKRVTADKAGSWLDRYSWRLKLKTAPQSKRVWADGNRNLALFQKQMRWLDWQLRAIRTIQRIQQMIKEGRLQSAIRKRLP